MTQGLTLLIPAKPDVERDAVADAWEARGGTVARLDRFWEPPPLDAGAVRLYGADTFCLVVAEVLGLDLVSPPDDLLLHASPSRLLRRITTATLGEVSSLRFPCFAKPLTPKQFRAAVYATPHELLAETRGLARDERIIVSDPVEFIAEVRCFMLGGEPVAAGRYEGSGDATDAMSFAAEYAQESPLPATCVLDVGRIESGWCLIEANARWSAGLNAAPAGPVVDCIIVATCRRGDAS